MHFTSSSHSSATASGRGALAGASARYASNPNSYDGGQYYAHPTPQRPRNATAQRGRYFAQGQQVRIRDYGSARILNAVVLYDASPRESVSVQTNGEFRSIPNDPDLIWV
ncbi:hypothetical protein M413DRAFT_25471 [Hebeloma cylindrosporum]|uniref:Uncharacterized protein n=1 Tax=Hebeloma cylindrosporum TaxID=76867 RepID=A0A0C3CIJ4_HEBCY|nr:hypothetical protein M413DRAFT_25471 [Hebeloma cylindrosporum h7]